MSHFGLKLELVFFPFFFVIGVAKLFLAPRIAWHHMKNSRSSSDPILDLSLNLGFFSFFGYQGDQTILNVKKSSTTHEKIELKLGPI